LYNKVFHNISKWLLSIYGTIISTVAHCVNNFIRTKKNILITICLLFAIDLL
jgi:hypothetical protein